VRNEVRLRFGPVIFPLPYAGLRNAQLLGSLPLKEPHLHPLPPEVIPEGLQLARFHGRKIFCNAQMSARDLKRFCKVDPAAEKLLETAMTKLGLSARAYTRILKVSRTIADLDGLPEITAAQVAEGIQYRSLGRSFQ
jgi:hypothetical protein